MTKFNRVSYTEGQKVGRRQKSEKGKEDEGEEDPEGDCTGSARGEEKEISREGGESAVNRRETAGRQKRDRTWVLCAKPEK